MCLGSELSRAKRALENIADRFEALGNRKARAVDDADAIRTQVWRIINVGRGVRCDEQAVWRAENQARCLSVRFLTAAEIGAEAGHFLGRIGRGRFLKPGQECDYCRQELTELCRSAKEPENKDKEVSQEQLDDLRSRLEGCLRSIGEQKQLEYGRRVLHLRVLSWSALLAVFVAVATALLGNYYFGVLTQSREVVHGYQEVLFGFGTFLTLAGIAGGVVAQGSSAVKASPYIRSLKGGFRKHVLMVFIGGLTGLALAFAIQSEMVLAPLAKTQGTSREYCLLTLAFAAGLVPSAASRLMASVIPRKQITGSAKED